MKVTLRCSHCADEQAVRLRESIHRLPFGPDPEELRQLDGGRPCQRSGCRGHLWLVRSWDQQHWDGSTWTGDLGRDCSAVLPDGTRLVVARVQNKMWWWAVFGGPRWQRGLTGYARSGAQARLRAVRAAQGKAKDTWGCRYG